MLLTRGDVDVLGAVREAEEELLRRFLGEVKADDRLFLFDFSRGVEVGVEDEVRAGLHRPGDAVGKEVRHDARRPTSQAAAGAEAGAAGAGVAGMISAGGLELPRLAAVVQVEERVVDDLAVAGAEIDGGDVLVLIQIQRNDEAAVDVAAFRLERVRSEEHTSELQSRQYLVCRL